VTSKTTRTLRTQHAPLARLLALVLLSFVAFAATVETVHQHGNVLPDRAGLTAPAFSGSSDAGFSLKDSRTFGDCLICQLHQNLSTALFSPLPQIIVPLEQAVRVPAVEISYLSQSDTLRRGRAPPLPSLF
jgi:hypothetical protein